MVILLHKLFIMITVFMIYLILISHKKMQQFSWPNQRNYLPCKKALEISTEFLLHRALQTAIKNNSCRDHGKSKVVDFCWTITLIINLWVNTFSMFIKTISQRIYSFQYLYSYCTKFCTVKDLSQFIEKLNQSCDK